MIERNNVMIVAGDPFLIKDRNTSNKTHVFMYCTTYYDMLDINKCDTLLHEPVSIRGDRLELYNCSRMHGQESYELTFKVYDESDQIISDATLCLYHDSVKWIGFMYHKTTMFKNRQRKLRLVI
jgi:hypothetical protein